MNDGLENRIRVNLQNVENALSDLEGAATFRTYEDWHSFVRHQEQVNSHMHRLIRKIKLTLEALSENTNDDTQR